jgi:hypothetical protein
MLYSLYTSTEDFKISNNLVANLEKASVADPNFFHPVSLIPDPVTKRFPDPDTHQRIEVYLHVSILIQTIVSKLSEI